MFRFGYWGSAAVTLIVLKLIGAIDCSWAWVLLPIPAYLALCWILFEIAFRVIPWMEYIQRRN